MLEIIKEIGIFIVIAQAILYFVPGESYVKYVKVIIGIIMIARIVQPILSLTTQESIEDILLESQLFAEDMEEFAGEFSQIEMKASQVQTK